MVQTETFNFGQNSQETCLNLVQGQLYFPAIGHPKTEKSRFTSHKRCEKKKQTNTPHQCYEHTFLIIES